MNEDARHAARDRIKERLSEYVDIKSERAQIRRIMKELECTRTAPGTSDWRGMPRGGGVADPMLSGLAQKERLVEMYQRKDAELLAAQEKIENMIDRLPSKHRKLMRYKYIEGLTWEKVCVAVGYAWRQTHRIHAEALDRLVDMEVG